MIRQWHDMDDRWQSPVLEHSKVFVLFWGKKMCWLNISFLKSSTQAKSSSIPLKNRNRRCTSKHINTQNKSRYTKFTH